MRFAIVLPILWLLFPIVVEAVVLPETVTLTSPSGKRTQAFNFLTKKKNPKVRVLFFWASWCDFCKEFSDVLETFKENPNLEIFSLGTDDERVKTVEAGQTKYKSFSWLWWVSPEERKKFDMKVLPVIVIINKEGQIDTIYEGSQADKKSYFQRRLKTLTDDNPEIL